MRARHGVALLPVLVLLGAALLLALAGAQRAQQGDRAARVAWHGERALSGVDAALLDALGRWPADSIDVLHPGDTDTLALGVDPTLHTIVTRTRLAARRYLVQATATVSPVEAGASGVAFRDVARRSVSRAVRLAWPTLPDGATLAVLGRLELSHGTQVLGMDTEPPGWGALCEADREATPRPAVVAEVVDADSSVALIGATPAHRRWSVGERAAAEAAFDRAFADLATLATRVTGDSLLDLDGTGTPGPCARWFGDARRGPGTTRACTRAWPIVHARSAGTTTLTGASPAQGTLLVDGDLVLHPGVTLHGLVLVRGRLQVAAAAAPPVTVSGLVLVRDQLARGSQLAHVRLTLGQCAARFALAAAGEPAPEPRHGWQQRP